MNFVFKNSDEPKRGTPYFFGKTVFYWICRPNVSYSMYMYNFCAFVELRLQQMGDFFLKQKPAFYNEKF